MLVAQCSSQLNKIKEATWQVVAVRQTSQSEASSSTKSARKTSRADSPAPNTLEMQQSLALGFSENLYIETIRDLCSWLRRWLLPLREVTSWSTPARFTSDNLRDVLVNAVVSCRIDSTLKLGSYFILISYALGSFILLPPELAIDSFLFRIWDHNSSVQHVQQPFWVEDIESLMPVWPTSMQVPLLKKRRFSEKQVLCMRPSSCSVATSAKKKLKTFEDSLKRSWIFSDAEQ